MSGQDEVDPPWWREKFTPEAIEARTKYVMALMEKEKEEEKAAREAKKLQRIEWEKLNKDKSPAEVDAYVYGLRKLGVSTKDIAHRAAVTVGMIHVRIQRHRKVLGIPPRGIWT